MKVVPLIILYLGTIERYVRSCISEVSQSCGDFSSQYGNNNQAAHGPSNCKQARQHPSRTAVTVAERVSSRDFKLTLVTRCENNRGLNFGGAGYKLTIRRCRLSTGEYRSSLGTLCKDVSTDSIDQLSVVYWGGFKWRMAGDATDYFKFVSQCYIKL